MKSLLEIFFLKLSWSVRHDSIESDIIIKVLFVKKMKKYPNDFTEIEQFVEFISQYY